jgi:hypothetical protein
MRLSGEASCAERDEGEEGWSSYITEASEAESEPPAL